MITHDCDLISAAAGSALSRLLQSMMTLAPRLLRSAAVILPMPVLAPVMTATLPSSRRELRHWPAIRLPMLPSVLEMQSAVAGEYSRLYCDRDDVDCSPLVFSSRSVRHVPTNF